MHTETHYEIMAEIRKYEWVDPSLKTDFFRRQRWYNQIMKEINANEF